MNGKATVFRCLSHDVDGYNASLPNMPMQNANANMLNRCLSVNAVAVFVLLSAEATRR